LIGLVKLIGFTLTKFLVTSHAETRLHRKISCGSMVIGFIICSWLIDLLILPFCFLVLILKKRHQIFERNSWFLISWVQSWSEFKSAITKYLRLNQFELRLCFYFRLNVQHAVLRNYIRVNTIICFAIRRITFSFFFIPLERSLKILIDHSVLNELCHWRFLIEVFFWNSWLTVLALVLFCLNYVILKSL